MDKTGHTVTTCVVEKVFSRLRHFHNRESLTFDPLVNELRPAEPLTSTFCQGRLVSRLRVINGVVGRKHETHDFLIHVSEAVAFSQFLLDDAIAFIAWRCTHLCWIGSAETYFRVTTENIYQIHLNNIIS